MNPQTWANIGAGVTAVLFAFAAYIRSRSTKQAIHEVKEVADTTHQLVNSSWTAALKEITGLRDFIKSNERPGDPSPPATTLPIQPPSK